MFTLTFLRTGWTIFGEGDFFANMDDERWTMNDDHDYYIQVIIYIHYTIHLFILSDLS